MGNNEFKKVRIKNLSCYYSDGIIKLEDFDLENILIEEKSHENILIYGILSILIPILYTFTYTLPIEKWLTLHNVIILIKSALNKDKNHYYQTMLLEKCLYQLAKK